MSPEQCRAGRALLGWRQSDLAAKSGVSLSSVRRFELVRTSARWRDVEVDPEVVDRMRAALEGAGVMMLPATAIRGVGARFRDP